jgi:mono/diheme cytochrome c family protein
VSAVQFRPPAFFFDMKFSLLLVVSFLSLGLAGADAPAPLQPVLEFDAVQKSFGSVDQGAAVKVVFNFKNAGSADLILFKLQTTCGCTAATVSTWPFKPGQGGQILVEYDTRGKIGFTRKDVSVYSNDPRSPIVLLIEGTVEKPAGHPAMKAGDVLFKGSCAKCHAEPAAGKSGAELYQAVCAMCHEDPPSKQGRWLAPNKESMAWMNQDELVKIIGEGLDETSMPGFLKKHGGPLTAQQVQSLMEFLSSLKQEGWK